MFSKLIDLIIDFIRILQCATIVHEYERGVRFRFGRAGKKALKPGLRLQFPFYVDSISTETVVLTTRDLPAQALTTKDGVSLVVSAVVTYRIKDVRTFMCEVEDADGVLADASRGTIRQVVVGKTWQEIQEGGAELDEAITKAVRRPAHKWGLKVEKVQLSDVARARAFRLFTDAGASVEIGE